MSGSQYISLYNETNGNFDNLIVTGDVDLSNANIIVGSIKFSDGTAPAPSITFAADTDTGIYRPGNDTVGITTGGVERFEVKNDQVHSSVIIKGDQDLSVTGNVLCDTVECLDIETVHDIEVGGNIYNSDGSSTAPSYSFDSDHTLGIYKNSAVTLSIASSGNEVARFNNTQMQLFRPLAMGTNSIACGSISSGSISSSGTIIATGQFLGPDGLNTSPTYSLASDPTTGMFRYASQTLGFSCGGTTVARFNTSSIQTFVPVTLNGNTLACGGLFSSGTISCGTNSLTCGALSSAAITSSGTFSNGTNAMTTGNITSGSISAGTNSITCGSMSVSGTITSTGGPVLRSNNSQTFDAKNTSGTYEQWVYPRYLDNIMYMQYGSNGFVLRGVGGSTTFGINSASASSFGGTVTTGTFAMTSGAHTCTALTSTGTMSCGTNSLTCGAISSSGTFSNGTNAMTSGAHTCTALTSTGTMSCGTNSLTCGAISSSGTFSNGTNAMTSGNISCTSVGATDHVYIKTATAATNGSAPLQIGGNASAVSAAPNILCYTFNDVYPLWHLVPFAHDDITMMWDCWRVPGLIYNSSSANSNFMTQKASTTLTTYCASGVSQGSSISFNVGTVLNASSQFAIGRNLFTTSADRFQVYGTDNSSSLTNNANISTYTSADNYPLLQIQSQQHNNIFLGFDTYWDGSTYRSSNSSSNFVFGKGGNQLKVYYGSGTAQGSIPSLTVASYWDTSGNFQCNNTIYGAQMQLSAQPCLMMSASTYINVTTATDTQFSGFDTTDYSSGSIGFSAGIATVPSIGTYLVCCEMTYDITSVGTGNYDELWILKNGATIYGRHRSPISSGNTMYLTTSSTMRLAASDTIQVYVRQASGSNMKIGTVTGSTARLEITKLH